MCTCACVCMCVCMYCTPTRQGRQCESETTSKSLESFAIRIACHYRAHLNIHISISLPFLLSLSLYLSPCLCFPSLSVGCAVGVRMSDKSVLHCDIVPYIELNIFTISFPSPFFCFNTQKATKNAINYEVLPENYFSLALAKTKWVLDWQIPSRNNTETFFTNVKVKLTASRLYLDTILYYILYYTILYTKLYTKSIYYIVLYSIYSIIYYSILCTIIY